MASTVYPNSVVIAQAIPMYKKWGKKYIALIADPFRNNKFSS